MRISAFYGASRAKCPQCRKGDMFSNNLYGFHLQHMHTNCSHCGLRFEREPGYFYAAMFISYGMNVAEMLLIGMLTYLITLNDTSPTLYIKVIMSAIIVLSPFNFRYARVILLYWLTPGIHYDSKS